MIAIIFEVEPHPDKAAAYFDMAADLNIPVVAEGIETVQDWDALANLDCRYGQGYFFSRPAPAAEAKEIASLWRAPVAKRGKPYTSATAAMSAA